MSHLTRLIATILVIFTSISLGYMIRRCQENGRLPISARTLELWRYRLQTLSIFVLLPFSAFLSLWGLPQPEKSLLILPFLGLLSYVSGGFSALAIARLLQLAPAQTGSFYCCATFTNLGAVGALVCLLFLGENTIALVALYRLLEEIFYFGVSFPIARKYGRPTAENNRKLSFVPMLAIIVVALLCGILLNLGGVPRPEWLGWVASCSMLAATIFFLSAIGITLRLSKIGFYWLPDLAMCLIKFVLSPAIIIASAALLGLGSVENGLPLKVCAILSCMPVAMTALVPPSLFNLDIDLANSCWLSTTCALALVLPLLMILLPQL